MTRELAGAILPQREVTHLQTHVGTALPHNLNGLVCHCYLRTGANVADIQVNLMGKGERSQQSHDIAKRVRQLLTPIAVRYGA